MKLSKLLQIALLGAAALGMGTSGAFAVCGEFGGFAVFQCADLAYIDSAPFTVTFDGASGLANNVVTNFWQVGFGNAGNNTGTGSTGTGNAGLTNFNGNDNGLFPVDIVHANDIDAQMPVNALCLRSNNWGNAGVDGCCDNNRDLAQPFADDNILNPYYNVYYAQGFGYPGYYSLQWQQDYPMALLVKSVGNGGTYAAPADDNRYFALAGVAVMDRGNIGGNGPCDTTFGGGNNPAPCDFRKGFYPFSDIVNGLTNPITGQNNVVPWQQVPRPAAACTADCSGAANRTIDFSWDVARWFDDDTLRPSQNPQMAPLNGTRAGGVGMRDLRRKTTLDGGTGQRHWNGLIHYNLQVASVGAGNVDGSNNVLTDTLNFVDLQAGIDQPTNFLTGQPSVSAISVTGVSAPPDTCYRVQVQVGKLTEVPAGPTNIPNCRIGRCGDRGYTVQSLDPAVITCIGGALISEKAQDLVATKAKGVAEITWSTTAEVSMTGFDLIAVTKRGEEFPLNDQPISCKQCNTGIGDTYSFVTGKGQLKGGVSVIRLEVHGGSPSSLQAPLQ